MIEIMDADNHGVVKTMDQMQPLEIGTVVECALPSQTYMGHIVFRTATSSDKFEVMDLTNPGEDCCWDNKKTITKIKVFIPNKTIFKINISNLK